MSVALGYETVGPVRSAVRARIEAKAARLSPPGGWWAEGLAFVPGSDGEDPLAGSTKLMLLDAPPELDIPMALRDAAFIIRRLAWWSLRHGLAWRVSIEGEDLGVIARGLPPLGVLVRGLQAAGVARMIARTPFLFTVRRRALREHAGRWDRARKRPAAAGDPADGPAWRDAARARHEREAQAAFREGRFADVLVAVAEAEKCGPLSELSKRYRELARKRV